MKRMIFLPLINIDANYKYARVKDEGNDKITMALKISYLDSYKKESGIEVLDFQKACCFAIDLGLKEK